LVQRPDVVKLDYHICKTLPCWPDELAGHFFKQSCLLFVGNISRRCEAGIQHHVSCLFLTSGTKGRSSGWIE
jgi:hypothetical protein